MAGRIVPVFRGVGLRWPRLRLWGAVLIAAGLVLREAQVVAVIRFEPWLLTVASLSGAVAAAGVLLASASILGTLRSSPREDAGAVRAEEGPVTADSNVARLLAAHPEALPILIEAGFAPLANPVLRHTLARAVTLRQACRMHGVDADLLVERIRGAGRIPAGRDA
ncbi:MAG: DUF1858 domain-containing protein [Planctomycetes bacterium]|nr:DUF1858 domain-containing protein [Planctomycetota bacterium]